MRTRPDRRTCLLWIQTVCLGLIVLGAGAIRAQAEGDDLELILIDKFDATTATSQLAKPSKATLIEYLPRPSKNEQAILDKLSQSVDVVFRDVDLPVAMSYLKDMYGLEFWIDQTRLPEGGVTVSLEMSNISLKSCLNLMLEPRGLCGLIEDDVLKVTTANVAESKIITRTYPVGDLVDSPDDATDLKELLICGLGLQPVENALFGLTISRKNPTLVLRGSHRLHDELLQLLRNMRQVPAAAEPGELVLTIGYERDRDGTKRGLVPQVICGSTIVEIKDALTVLQQERERLTAKYGQAAIQNLTVVIRQVDTDVSVDWMNQLLQKCQTAGFTRFSSRMVSERH